MTRISILACLLALAPALAQAQPRHIYRDGQYFFCPYPGFDRYCQMPNDYSVALHGPRPEPIPFETRPGPAVLAVPPIVQRAIQNALRPRYVPPPQPAPPPQMSMEQEREYIIQQGEAHCRKFPQDTKVCHPAK